MTIAIGFVAKNGIVLAVDTKESYGTDDHTYVDKLSMLECGNDCQVGMAGSGTGYLIDYIVPRIKSMISEHSTWTLELFTAGLEKLMAEIYASDSISSFPHSSATDLYCDILIAIQLAQEQPALFVVHSSLVTQITGQPFVIGYGPMQEMANEMYSLDLNIEEASTAALYLIHDAKRRYGAVGGVVHIFKLFGNRRVDFERTWDQPARESLLNDLRLLHYRMVVTVATPNVTSAEYSRIMRLLANRARNIRAAFQKLEHSYQEWVMRMIGLRRVNFRKLPRAIQDAVNAKRSTSQTSKDQR
jgi:20S proteasome alpha/beta subunit